MAPLADSMTTESLRKKFKNNFDLCNFAINIGRNTVMGGSNATLGDIIEDVEARATQHVKSAL